MPSRPPRYRPTRTPPAEAARPNAAARGYGYRWQQESRRFLDQNPLCVVCQAAGRVTGATCVDHVTPHRGDETLFWDEANWQPLCARCHNSKTARGE